MRTTRTATMIMAAVVTVWLGAAALTAESAPAPQPAAAKPSPAKPSASKKATGAKTGGAAKGKSAKKAAPAVKETVEGPEVREFRTFCDSWMQKLRDRETYNTANIKWETHEGRVAGEYLAYGKDCTCSAREEAGKDPIGKLTYREMRYRREGASQTEALAAPGTIVEQSDVTEIFRYGKGRWQY